MGTVNCKTFKICECHSPQEKEESKSSTSIAQVPPPQPIPSDWRDEFDNLFVHKLPHERAKNLGSKGYSIGSVPAQDIKAFIAEVEQSAIQTTRKECREEVVKMVESMKKEDKCPRGCDYVQALSDLLTKIQEK